MSCARSQAGEYSGSNSMARLAKPLAPEDIRLPTDSFIEPNDLEFYLLGRTEGAAPRSD